MEGLRAVGLRWRVETLGPQGFEATMGNSGFEVWGAGLQDFAVQRLTLWSVGLDMLSAPMPDPYINQSISMY